MKQNIMLSLLAAICAAVCFSGCINDDMKGADLQVGDMIPSFKVTMNDGSEVSDKSLSGNVSCIVFFHTTCPDCQRTLPVVQKIYDAYSPEGVGFALISREQSQEDIEAFWNEKGLDMPFSAQKDRKVYSKFAQSRIPRVYICDKDGIIRYIYTDDPTPMYDDLRSALYELTGLDVEEEVHDVAVLDNVLLSLDSELSCSSTCSF